ncbi:hypothetical protein BDV97DRAFT_297385 [Delphinella strobiligena]|nr:hypothetical protein BDV97DRAFT_297385 [Delphinella strobiligena]
MKDTPRREHRPLAPSHPSRGQSSPSVGSVIHEPRDPRAAKPKRAVVHVACLACRKLRIKCDGQRPLCTPCSRREEACEYDVEANTTRTSALKRKNETLEREVEHYKELYRVIREQPEYDAAEVFRRIRATEEPLEVLEQLKTANGLVDGMRRSNSFLSEDMAYESISDGFDEDTSKGRGKGKAHENQF